MDRLDVRILRELLQGEGTPLQPEFRRSFRAISKRLHIDEDTVRNRVRRFEDTGLVRDWHLVVNPHFLNQEDVGAWFDVSPAVSMEDLVARLQLLEGMLIIIPMYTNAVGLIMRHRRASLERQLELVQKLCGGHVESGRIPWPPCSAKFSRTDGRIINALLANPRRPLAQVSKEAGVSDRTVNRRLRRMIRNGDLAALARLDQRSARDFLFAELFVSYPGELKGGIDAEITAHYSECIWHVLHLVPLRTGEDHHCVFNLILHNISEADEISSWVGSVPGVSKANVYVVRKWIHIYESLDEQLVERLSTLPRRSGSGA